MSSITKQIITEALNNSIDVDEDIRFLYLNGNDIERSAIDRFCVKFCGLNLSHIIDNIDINIDTVENETVSNI